MSYPTDIHPWLSRSLASPQRGLTLLRPLLAAAPDSIDSVESDSEMYDEFEGVRQRDRGFTPFEFIEFTDIPLKHEVSVWVDRPIGDCYQVWDNRLNWMQWFDMIDEVGFHEEEPSYISMYLWYRWGKLSAVHGDEFVIFFCFKARKATWRGVMGKGRIQQLC